MHIRPVFETNPNYHQTSPYFINNSFTKEELEWIGNLQELYPYQDASIGEDNRSQLDESIRKSKIKWIHHDDKSWWLYDKLANYIQEANKSWGFTINSIIDSIQYTEYYEGGGHYDWHADLGPGLSNRKLSCVLQLSDPGEYEGGELQMNVGGSILSVPKELGLICFFPSFLLHRVTPLTSGVRTSLVTWLCGANLR
jgi:PKHD-type hydroxylase